ncbi:hypothetical protein [Scytonema sp. PRP1]
MLFAHPHPLGAVAYDGCYPTNSSQGSKKQELTTKILVIARILLKFNNN